MSFFLFSKTIQLANDCKLITPPISPSQFPAMNINSNYWPILITYPYVAILSYSDVLPSIH